MSGVMFLIISAKDDMYEHSPMNVVSLTALKRQDTAGHQVSERIDRRSGLSP